MKASESKNVLDFFHDVAPSDKQTLLEAFAILKEEMEVNSEVTQVREVVPIRQWLSSTYFLGSHAKNLYPFWREEIVDFIEGGYSEWIITGAIGTGKSFAAEITAQRKLYELSCYDFPQRLFGLADISKIFFAYLSVSRSQAELTGFGDIRAMVDDTIYFQRHFQRDKEIDSVLKFPQKVFFVPGSDALHVIGTNLFGAILDETNFLKAGGSGKAGDLAKAAALYREITDRRRSRFVGARSRDVGFSLLVSSSTHYSSFTETRIKKADSDTKVTISRPWDAKPKGEYSSKKFFVFKGTEYEDPVVAEKPEDIYHLVKDEQIKEGLRIEQELSDSEDEVLMAEIVELLPPELQILFILVPEDFLKDFRDDVVAALRNIAGESTAPTGKLFSAGSVWQMCTTTQIRHPFGKETFTISLQKPGEIIDFMDVEYFFKEIEGKLYPRRHPHARRYVHIDQSISGDPTGMGMCHIGGMRIDRDTGIKLPLLELDFALRIIPPPRPDKISIAKVRKFFFDLRDRHVIIGKLTYDQYQSTDSIQIMQSHGIPAEHQSLDKDDKQWVQFNNLLYETRFLMYDYKPLRTEYFDLDHDQEKHKVDHPPENFKDVSDGVVGASNNALEGHAKIPAYAMENAGEILVRVGGTRKKGNTWLVPGYEIDDDGTARKIYPNKRATENV